MREEEKMRNDCCKKALVIGIIVLFIGMSSITSTSNLVEKTCINIMYSPHDPIYIHGNDNFTSENGVSGGSGTHNDPYIIEGWEINASSQHGITIIGVNVYFTIRDCYIHDGGINDNRGCAPITPFRLRSSASSPSLQGFGLAVSHSAVNHDSRC